MNGASSESSKLRIRMRAAHQPSSSLGSRNSCVFFFFFFNLCIYWLCRVFIAALGLSLAVVCGLLIATASLVAERRL